MFAQKNFCVQFTHLHIRGFGTAGKEKACQGVIKGGELGGIVSK